jgi:hypothetical protein
MSLHLDTIGTSVPLRSVRRVRGFGMMPCPHCAEILLAPDVSEYLGDGRVRHSWSCDACGHEFKASIEVAPR